jgi:hypothetical protein
VGSRSEGSGLEPGRFVRRLFWAGFRCGCEIFDSILIPILNPVLEPEKHYNKKEEQQNCGRAQKAQAGFSAFAADA